VCRFYISLIAVSFLAASCKQVNVYEKNIPIPHYKWQHNFPADGSFNITDTTTSYNIYIVLRHTDAYKYNNIWLKIGLQEPGDSMHFQNKDLTLANDATGWEGSGMNDIWEVRKLIYINKFKRAGEYRFTINQIMRDNPLPDVMSAGIRVQPVTIVK
jgi:gliding motility-associated lipoprotein GldH